MPPYSDKKTEAKIDNAKYKLHTVIDNYAAKSKGNNNPSQQERSGIKELQTRIKNKEIFCYQTDNSGRFSIDTTNNYKEAMIPHTENMQKVGDIEYKEVEKSLNAHMSAWVRIFQGDDRTANNYQATNNAIPPLYGIRKDHKHCEDQVK